MCKREKADRVCMHVDRDHVYITGERCVRENMPRVCILNERKAEGACVFTEREHAHIARERCV